MSGLPAPFDLLPLLLQGTGVTVQLTILGTILGFVAAFFAGLGRLSKNRPLRWGTAVYVEVFRGTSVLVQLFWFFFALPFFGIELSPMTAAVLVLGLNFGAYGSEVVRSSILAVPLGQAEAAIALNMTPGQRMRRIILPQAFVIMLPSFGNLLIELLKVTSLVSLVTLADLTFQGMVLNNSTFRTTEIFSLLLVIYFILAYLITLAVRSLERRVSSGRA